MPITFGNPALLFGAAAAALPLIIHFLSRRRVRREPFSDLRFLDEVQAHRARSLGIRRWLLLLLRMLILLLLALAAAAPRWGGLAGGGGRAVLCVIDTSASMATRHEDGTRFEAALAACGDILAGLPGGASVQVLAAGTTVEPLFDDWLPVGAGARGALSTVRQGHGGFDLEAALREVARQVERAPGMTVEVVVLSDLQDGPTADLAAAAARLTAAGRVRVLVRRVGDRVSGGGVRAVHQPERVLVEGERITVTATVTSDRPDEVFTLSLDGLAVAEAVAPGEGSGPQRLEFPLTVPAAGLHRGSVRKAADAFSTDDERTFVLAVPRRVEVLLGHGAERPDGDPTGRGGWRVAAAALAPTGGDDLFRVSAVPSGELTTAAMGDAALTVLVDPGSPGRQVLEALRQDLSTGGALFLLVGDPTLGADLTGTWQPLLGLPTGARFTAAEGAVDRHAQVISPDHPVFAGLPTDALTTLEDVGWRRWFQVAPGEATTLLATTAGDDPLLLTGGEGRGRWAFLATNLQPDATGLPGSSMTLPLLRRLGTWLARPRLLAATTAVEIGQTLAVQPLEPRGTATFADPGALVVAGPAPGARRAAALDWQGDRPFLAAGTAAAPGFAVFLAGGDTVGLAAIGLPPEESNLGRREAAPWGERLVSAGIDFAGDLTVASADDIMTTLGGRPLAPLLFMLAALVLALELWLGRGASGAAAVSRG